MDEKVAFAPTKVSQGWLHVQAPFRRKDRWRSIFEGRAWYQQTDSRWDEVSPGWLLTGRKGPLLSDPVVLSDLLNQHQLRSSRDPLSDVDRSGL